jgi:hypothetical protein
MIIVMRWEVVYGGGNASKYFPDIKQAKEFARDYENAQIVERSGKYKFVRFVNRNQRLKRVHG